MPDEKLARAIRDKKRRDILQLLCNEKKVSVHGVASEFNLTESSASKHLKLLYDLGFLNIEKKANEKFYSLKVKEIKPFLKAYIKVVQKL